METVITGTVCMVGIHRALCNSGTYHVGLIHYDVHAATFGLQTVKLNVDLKSLGSWLVVEPTSDPDHSRRSIAHRISENNFSAHLVLV